MNGDNRFVYPLGDNIIKFRMITGSESWYRNALGVCIHGNLTFDSSINQVKCNDCDELLSPYWVISYLLKESKHREQRIKELRELETRYQARSKTRCKHCGKFTPTPFVLKTIQKMP